MLQTTNLGQSVCDSLGKLVATSPLSARSRLLSVSAIYPNMPCLVQLAGNRLLNYSYTELLGMTASIGLNVNTVMDNFLLRNFWTDRTNAV